MNQYSEVPRIGLMLTAVQLDYVDNIHQNSVILTHAANIKQDAQAMMRLLGPTHPGYQLARRMMNSAGAQEQAETDEDIRHKEIKAALNECMPQLTRILKVLQAISPDVGELLPKLKKLQAVSRG